jgi:hypothetical protein
MSEVETCPKCSARLPSRFATGRIICSRCGWTDKPKSTVVSNVSKQRTPKSNYPADLASSFGRRFSDFIKSTYLTDTLFLLEGEKIIFRTKRHWIGFTPPIVLALLSLFFIILPPLRLVFSFGDFSFSNRFFIFIFCIFIGVISFLPLGIAYLDFKSSEFIVTNKRVIAGVGILRRNSIEILLSKVEAIAVEQSILGRIFNYGTVVTGGTGSSKNPFTRICEPFSVRRHVREQVDLIGSEGQESK